MVRLKSYIASSAEFGEAKLMSAIAERKCMVKGKLG
jgi:hypothetical protein